METLSAREAAERLGIQLQTLYAYVSRGLLTSTPSPASRAKRYLRVDVERLVARRGRRVAQPGSALRWGQPVLASAITEITPAGPRYRGHDALDLARADTPFEAVAELLWGNPCQPRRWTADRAEGPRLPKSTLPLARFAVWVPWVGARDAGRSAREPAAVHTRARALIRTLAASLAPDRAGRDASLAAKTTAKAVARSLGVRGKAQTAAIDRALVLWADHELNVSAFAARVAASAHADVYACVSAGLAALSGPRHGGMSERVEALIEEVGRPERAASVVEARRRRGDPVPGFGHPLYPDGDPRGRLLLEDARRLGGGAVVDAVVDAVRAGGGGEPSVDVGLVALARALGLRRGWCTALTALGRCAGWVAHTLEQYEADFLIRPRAEPRSN